MTRFNRILILVALLMFSTAAFAMMPATGNWRLDTLNGGDSFNSNFWEDSNCVLHWYGEIVNYTDMLTINLDAGEGAALNKSTDGYGSYFLGLYRGDAYGPEWNNIRFGYGYELENMNLGIMINRQGTSATTAGDGGGDVKETWHDFGFGIDYQLNDETNIDASFTMTKGSSEDLDDDDDNDLDASGMAFGVRAFRACKKEGMTIIPVFMFSKMTPMDDVTETTIALGAGMDYEINDGNNLILGLNWQKYTNKDERGDGDAVETSQTTFPGMSLAVEHEFFDWLTVRAGATKRWIKAENDAENVQMSYPYNLNFGAGIALGDWQVDLGLNTDWLYNLGYWVHGNITDGEEPIAGIQAKLYF
ncbi:MAG: hypothetical protein GY835_05420 [bacterium]|nr:hypothetical protein [bacterium]